MRYTVWIVSPVNYGHEKAFCEVALSLRDGLRGLGHECEIVSDLGECEGKTIVLGANATPHLVPLGEGFIIYNFEQVAKGSPWMTEAYLNLLAMHEVWDYSVENIRQLENFGILNVKHCEVGYMPVLLRIVRQEETIDVLLYGSMNDRRGKVVDELMDLGVNVKVLPVGTYGSERDDFISRSKIVLNCHYYGCDAPFEIVRCSYLMANKKCIVSETGLDDEHEGIYYSDYDGLAGSCLELLGDDKRRLGMAQLGFDAFSLKSQTDILRRLV